MGAFHSTEDYSLPDLSINVDLEEGATIPTFDSPGRGGLTLYAREDVVIEANKPTRVPTGVTASMPFMLVGMVVTHSADQLHVSTRIVDYDTKVPIEVDVTFRPRDLQAESSAIVKKGDPIAMLVLLPIARPGLRVSRPARDDDEAVACVVCDDDEDAIRANDANGVP